MSERKAKKIRKEQVAEPVAKKKEKKNILFNVVSVVLVLAFLGLGAFAVVSDMDFGKDTETSTDANAEITTLGDYAGSIGISYEQMAEQYGFSPDTFNKDMLVNDAVNLFTIEHIAKMNNQDVNEFKETLGIPEDVKTDVPSKDLSTEVMMKLNGYQDTLEELREYGLSEDITEETPWGETQEAVYNAAVAKFEAQQATDVDGADGE